MKTDDSLWAITTYFNPVRYRSRRENFRLFRELLPVPLIAVEYSIDEFELGERDADVLIQLRGRDVLWVKERLYNIARRHLPPHCEQVLWLDCDIALGGTDWPEQVKEALRSHALVQPYRRLELLGPRVRPPPDRDDQVIDWRTSLVDFLAQGANPASVYSAWGTSLTLKYAHGIAWAARRSLCDQFEFYDRLIVGGGDKVFTAAVFGQHELVAPTFAFDDRYRRDYLQWAGAVNRLVNGSLGSVDTSAYHLWHGAISNRGYDDRQNKLYAAGFSAMHDLALDTATGCWRWASDKPALHEYVRSHFIRRREDG
jgi:hypothetical protein